MTKLMKRIGAVLLCFCMLMPMCPEQAFADTTLTEAEITIEIPKVQDGSQTVEISVPAGANYEVQLEPGYINWLEESGNPASAITSGNEYSARFTICPKEGYRIASGATVTVNDSTENVNLLSGDSPGTALVSLSVEFKTNPQVSGTIDTVELSGVPTGEIGSMAEPYSYDGANYTVTGTWCVYNPATQAYDPMQNTDVFQQGKIYALGLVVETKKGYVFCDEPQLIIDGENFEIDGKTEFSIHKGIYVSYTEEINTINLLSVNYPKAEIGKTFTDTELDIAVPAGSHYTASGHWVYRDEEGNEFAEGTFENGKAYYLRISIVPEDGYAFAESVGFYIDEELQWIGGSPALILYDESVSFKQKIDKVTLLNLPTATVGGTAQVGIFDVEVPADANYTATAEWNELDGNIGGTITESVFKENKIYKLWVFIKPNEGYDFAETVYVNAYGVEHKESGVDPERIWFDREYSFLKEIEKIEISFLEPKVGDSVAENLASFKVPADANYVIDYVKWVEMDTHVPATTFEKGHDYMYYVTILPKEGYGFNSSTKVIANGETLYIPIDDPVYININQIISFKEIIQDVQITNIPTMEIGKTASTAVKVPDGAKYTAEAEWIVWSDSMKRYEHFDGTFEKGKVYELRVHILPNEGYRFSEEDTIFKVDGKEYEDVEIWSDGIALTKEFQTEHKVIERIELKIEEPVIGNHSSIPPVITIVGDANFTVLDDDMHVHWVQDKEGEPFPFYDEYFVADKTYGVAFTVIANDGYVFSEDLVIVINGKVIPKDAYSPALKVGDVVYIFGIGTDEVKDEPVIAPKTGDESPVGLWIAVFMMGIFVCGNALRERKHR